MEQEETVDFDFIRILVNDVQHALNLARNSNEQTDKRNLIRTIISAIEGLSWHCRNHIQAIIKDIDHIPPFIELAFSETTYSINAHGILVQQPRFIPMTTMIRFLVNVAKTFCPDLNIDFGSEGWDNLKKATAIRNRITHPKSVQDLEISDQDIDIANMGFFWFLDITGDVMESMMHQLRVDTDLLRQILKELNEGDLETIALYHSVLTDIHD
ncbi:MAG: hypothetical protein ABI395_12575 [Sphingobium sp.]